MNRGVILILALGLWGARLAAGEPAPSATVLADNVRCIRVGYLTDNFAAQLTSLPLTNRLAGTVLDLRFADGDSGAVAPAAKFISENKSPLVILVNRQTSGAAAELARRLRTEDAGIVIGSADAAGTIAPDVAVTVNPDDEKQFQEHPYAWPATNRPSALPATNSLLAFVDHTSEDELVRKHIKDGEEEDDGNPPPPRSAPAQPVIRDPALARAVDLLHALAALHKSRG
jgi:hypothetical protein